MLLPETGTSPHLILTMFQNSCLQRVLSAPTHYVRMNLLRETIFLQLKNIHSRSLYSP